MGQGDGTPTTGSFVASPAEGEEGKDPRFARGGPLRGRTARCRSREDAGSGEELAPPPAIDRPTLVNSTIGASDSPVRRLSHCYSVIW
jgi:hypothetical protein